MGPLASQRQDHAAGQDEKQGAFSVLKGFFAGGFWGAVLGGATLTVASLASEQPAGNAPPATPQVTAPETAVDTTPDAPAEIAPVATQDDAAAEPVGIDVAPAAPVVTDDAGSALADTTPAPVPQIADATETTQAPAEPASADLTAQAEDPVLPNPQSIAPQAPVSEEDLIVSTTPAELPAPVEVDTPDATPDAPVTIVTPQPTLNIPVPQPRAPEIVVVDTPEVSEPAAALPEGDSAVIVRRPVDDTEVAVEVETVTPAPLPTGPALDVFAASFENPDDKPLIAIALLDDGAMNGAVTAVTSLPFAVTVVMNPDLPDVAQRMADYRAAGVEVAVQASLPTGAAASDIEVALEGTFSQINQAVMLVDTGAGGLQGDRSATEQTMARLATDGRGFLTASKGLNATIRAAEKAGVPAATIFRDLDADGQDARVIRRFLDQAAFRARQESGVTLLARVRPDTISALVLWGTANRAGQVAVAPVSAILKAQ